MTKPVDPVLPVTFAERVRKVLAHYKQANLLDDETRELVQEGLCARAVDLAYQGASPQMKSKRAIEYVHWAKRQVEERQHRAKAVES